MNDLSDAELLRRFVKEDSQAAFAVLVERYLGLVHSVAFRQTNNLQHAQDISQAVFIILARKAAALASKTILSGWLYHTARLTAANFNRAEWRRTRREQEAFMQSQTIEPSSDDPWLELSPHLETAMAQLGHADRDALVMRYFQNRTMAEVGTAFGWTENTAQKRVGRALEKLRKSVGKRGIALTAGTLAATLSANAVQAAPAGLAQAITPVAATKGAAASVATAKLVKATLKIMPWPYLAGLVSLVSLYVSSAVGLATVFVRMMTQMFKREDAGESSSRDFVERFNGFELRKKYANQFTLFVALAFVCFVSYAGLTILTDGDPEASAHLRTTARYVVISVFLTAAFIVWRKIGGFRGWNARLARRNEIIQKELWADDPNPAVPMEFEQTFENPFKQAGWNIGWQGACAFLVTLVGLACCVVSFICMVRRVGGLGMMGFFAGGWMLGVTGTYLGARARRKSWLLADARCINQSVKRVFTSGAGGGEGGGGGSGFSAVIVCEYEHNGIKYRVTPKITAVSIVTFPTQGSVERYLRKRIAPDGSCKLHINPANPLQTTLYGGGPVDRFLLNQDQK